MQLSQSTTGAIKQNAVLVDFPISKEIDPSEELRIRLINVLQSTLDLQELFELFLSCVRQVVPVDGLSFTGPTSTSAAATRNTTPIDIQLGNPRAHHCDYRLINQDECLGEVSFSRKSRFSQDELAQLEIALSTLIYPVRNAVQYQHALKAALIDPLTLTGNRIALDNALHRELRLVERYRQDLSLLMIDIDHFKQINDVHGHCAGDEVLRNVAKSIKHLIRDTDMTFRFGGEEFVVVLSKTDLVGAALIAERIREQIENLETHAEGSTISATVSIGISTLRDKEHIKELFDRADDALYAAKNQGRNQVAIQS